MTSDAPLIVRVERGVGRLTLNRPKALHALNTAMCREMITALLAWRDDPAVVAVLLDSAPPRGFCAGGDIRALSSTGEDGGAAAREFFRVEYRLNALLFDYPKPTVALMDGVVMGGGVGISAPCRYRIATERTLFAMPETAIGLFPDVGGGWWLPRLPGRAGLWLGLTGARLKAADMLLLGLATDVAESARLPELVERLLADPGDLQSALTQVQGVPGPPDLALHTEAIDRLFAGDGVPAILRALEADGGAWAGAQAALLGRVSPQALAVTYHQLELGAQANTFAEGDGAGIRPRRQRSDAARHGRGRAGAPGRQGQRPPLVARHAGRRHARPRRAPVRPARGRPLGPRFPPPRAPETTHEDRLHRPGRHGLGHGRQPGQGRPRGHSLRPVGGGAGPGRGGGLPARGLGGRGGGGSRGGGHHAARRPPRARGLRRGGAARRGQVRAPDRLLDHRRGLGAGGGGAGGRGGLRHGRRPRLRRHGRGRRRRADLHGGLRGRRLRAGARRARPHGQGGDPRRPGGRWAGGQDLQQT